MVWLPHSNLLDIDDFCPEQFYTVMAVHAITVFVGVMLGFGMGYRATSKILAESWEILPIYKMNFYLSYLALNIVMIAWPLKIIFCLSVSAYSGFLLQMIALLANIFVIISLVTTWIARIRIELRDTAYEAPRWQNMCLVILYSVGVIAAVIGTIGLTVSWTIDSVSLLDESAILIVMAAGIYIVLSIIFLFVFAGVLRRIARSGPQRGMAEQDIEDKMMKYAGLSLIGLVSAVVSLVFKGLVIAFEDFSFGIQLVSFINTVDSLINFIMLYFQYGFATQSYFWWCACIHNTLKARCDKHDGYVPTDMEDDDDSHSGPPLSVDQPIVEL